MLSQQEDGVEICISDNASADGTVELVEHLQSEGAPLIYRRRERDLGPAVNIMSAVALAQGTWCWLLSSDDALAPGAVSQVLRRLETGRELLGMTVARASFDRALRDEIAVEVPALRPETPQRARAFDDPREAITQLGLLQTYLSSQVVRREAWQAVADAGPPPTRWFPHTWMIARIVLDLPGRWAWLPAKLVLARGDAQDFATVGGTHATATVRLPAEALRLWRHLLGGRSEAYRTLERKTMSFWASPEWIGRLKTMPGHTARDDVRLLGLIRVYWRQPGFWPGFPLLLVPGRILRRWSALAERIERPMRPFDHADLKGRVRTELPARVGAGHDLHLSCTVENLGPHTLRHALPHPVRLGARWMDEHGNELPVVERWALHPSLAPGESRHMDIVLRTPWEPGEYTLSVGLVQELVAWYDALDLAAASSGAVSVVRGLDEPVPSGES